jgi:hypothetical protein
MMGEVQRPSNSKCFRPLSESFRIYYFLCFSDTKQPKLLIIYTASTVPHIRVVGELAEYLRKFCFVDVLLDILDIPKTKKKVLKVYTAVAV